MASPGSGTGGGVPARSPAGRDRAGGGAGAAPWAGARGGPWGSPACAGKVGVNQSASASLDGRLAVAPNQSSTCGTGP